jgi:hypothetical protein
MDEALTPTAEAEPAKPGTLTNAWAMWRESPLRWWQMPVVAPLVLEHGFQVVRRWAFYKQPVWIASWRLGRTSARLTLHRRASNALQARFQGPPGGSAEMAETLKRWEDLQAEIQRLETRKSWLMGIVPHHIGDSYAPWSKQ